MKVISEPSVMLQCVSEVYMCVTGSDSKSSPDTGSDKAGSVGELGGSKYSKRVQLRR